MKSIPVLGSMLVVASLGAATSGIAEEGGLDVTMRVLEDISGIDAVVIELSAGADEAQRTDEGEASEAPDEREDASGRGPPE